MVKKILIFSLFFYFLTLFQVSFSPRFFKNLPNSVLIVLFFINFFAPHQDWTSLISAPIAGFFLDIFSGKFFGYYLLISLSISFFAKFILKKYIQPVIYKSKSLI